MAQNYSGVSPIAALLSGLVQGGGQQYLREQEEDRRAQFNAANILLNAGIATGELGSLVKIVDPRFLKSMGLTPDVIGQVDQLLEPIRAERQSRLAAQSAQTQLTGAQTGLVGEQTKFTQARTEMEKAQAQALPAQVAAQTTQAGAAQLGAEASMLRAEKELTFGQQMQLLDKRIQGQLDEAGVRAQSAGRDEADRALQQRFGEAKKNWRQAMNSFLQLSKPDPKTGEKLFASEEEAANAIGVYNGAAMELNQIAQEMAQKYGGEASLVPVYGVEPVKSWIGSTSGYRAKPMSNAPSTETMQQQGSAINLGQEEEIMKRFKKSK